MDDLLHLLPLQVGPAGQLVEPFDHDALYPLIDLPLKEDDVLHRIVASRPHGVALRVRGAAGVDDVDEGVGLPQVVQELVAQPFAQMGVGDEAGHVQELDRHQPDPVLAGGVPGLAFDIEVQVRAPGTYEAHALVGLDGGERIVCDLGRGHRGRREECGLAHVGLPYDPDQHALLLSIRRPGLK